jgi:disulfide bond formation protein DsbB
MKTQNNNTWIFFLGLWIVALISTLGSLFFSEVMKYPPCVLCWYQRICMYPLVMIFFVGLFPLDKNIIRFSLPLVISGWAIALYHNLLYYKILPESAAPCQQGISCTTTFIKWWGFMTIPLLSLIAFSILLVSLLLSFRKKIL